MHCPSKIDLAAYSDGELPRGPSEKIEKHLSSCPTCAQEYAGLENLKSRIHSLPFQHYGGRLFLPALGKKEGIWRRAFLALVLLALIVGTSLFYNFFNYRQQLAGVEQLLAEHTLGEQLHVDSYGLFGN